MLPGSIPAGTRLGDYRIVSELGRGGMGVVYKAEDVNLGRAVAIKVLPRGIVADPKTLERFRREARAAALVTHPAITTIHQVSETNGSPYIVFELMAGGSLGERLKKEGPLPWRDAVELMIPVARALGAIHAAGLVHRDLKPANVLLDHAGRPKLSDFGLVRGGTDGKSLTGAGEVVGTATYLAPEQASDGHVGPAADMYSLGCTLYALLTGAPPFQGENFSVIARHLTARPTPPRELVPAIPARVDAIVRRLLEKEPSRRGGGADALAAELEALLEEPATSTGAAGGAHSRKPLAVLALLVAVGLAGAGVKFLAAPRPEKPKLELALTSPTETTPVYDGMPIRVLGDVKPITSHDRVLVNGREVPLVQDRFSVTLAPDAKLTAVTVVLVCPDGQRVEVVRHLARSPLPSWYVAIPEERRPRRLPLPSGLAFDRVEGDFPVYVFTKGDVSLEMVYVPPGPFLMGCDRLGSVPPEESPEHDHPMPHGYWIGRFETTWEQFLLYCKATGRPEPLQSGWDDHIPGPKEPVVQVSWNEAVAFGEWVGTRLPSEAEWEKAARGTTGWVYPWGDQPDPLVGMVCNYADPSNMDPKTREDMKTWPRQNEARSDGYFRTAPVGTFPRDCSPYGAFDMAGNAQEMCQDWHDATIYQAYAVGRFDPPRVGRSKVVRGGSWNGPWWGCHIVLRTGAASVAVDFRSPTVGFRVALSEDD